MSPAGFPRVVLPRALRDPHAELAHPLGDSPGERLRAEPPRDLERLDERRFVVEQRQHQRTVVRPHELAELVRRGPPVAAHHRRVWAQRRPVQLDLQSGHGRPARQPDREAAARPPVRPHVAGQQLEALGQDRPAPGQGQLGLQLDHRQEPLRLAGAVGVSLQLRHALGRVVVAAPHGQLG